MTSVREEIIEIGKNHEEEGNVEICSWLNKLAFCKASRPHDYNLYVPEKLLVALGNPQEGLNIVHVGGTNGKGSTSAMLAAMFISAGFKTGQFSSPHLTSIRERCLINGKLVDANVFYRAMEDVRNVSEKLNLHPSYFEAVCITVFLTMFRIGVQRSIVEVGLGGRLDTTNIIKSPMASLITSIDFDHCDHLGNSIVEIAKEKAGIFKFNVPCFVGSMQEEAKEVFRKKAKKLRSSLFFYNEQWINDDFKIHLKGAHQRRNASLAIRAARFFRISEEHIIHGLQKVRWPGRLELCTYNNSELLLDVAHNPSGLESFFDYLSSTEGLKLCRNKKLVCGFSFLSRKDWQGMLAVIHKRVEELEELTGKKITKTFLPLNHPQSLSKDKIDNFSDLLFADSLVSWLEVESQKSELIFLFGSIFLIAEIKEILPREDFSSYEGV